MHNKTGHTVAQEGGRHQQGQLSEKRKNSKRKLYLHKHDALVHTKCFGPSPMQKFQNILMYLICKQEQFRLIWWFYKDPGKCLPYDSLPKYRLVC